MSNGGNREPLLQLVESQTSLQNRFSNIRRIDANGGGGYFSLVFTADDLVSGKRVVIKVFDPFQQSAYRIESFKRESEMLQQLVGQEGILQIVAPRSDFHQTLQPFGFQVPVSYFVAELADTSVEKAIDHSAWDTEEILIAFRQMCRSIQRIHTQRITHRDLKPSNFLVMTDGQVKLSDFGTARDLRLPPILTDYAGMPPGDIRYTAPELLASLHDEAPEIALGADIFSLGAIFFELMTGLLLVPNIFDAQFQSDLVAHMAAVPRGQRRQTFDAFVADIADARPLPDLKAFSPRVSACVIGIANDLYKAMAAIDYRYRLTRFEQIFLKISQCLLVVRNEEKIRRWRERKSQFHKAAIERHERIAETFAVRIVARKT